MDKLLIFIISVALTACNNAVTKDETSTLFAVARGSTLILNQPLEIPPNRSSVLVQYGKVVPSKIVNIYHANCALEINTISDSTVTIHPDTFRIYDVYDEMNSVSLGRTLVASLGETIASSSADFNFTTVMLLRSDKQPDVLRLACMHWESLSDSEYLTIEQMRQAMGEIFTLKLAQ